MKNLIPYKLFEDKVISDKEKILKKKIMRFFEEKYLDKFTSDIGEVANNWLKQQKIDELYEYSDIKLSKVVYPEIDKLIINKLKRNDQFKKLFLNN